LLLIIGERAPNTVLYYSLSLTTQEVFWGPLLSLLTLIHGCLPSKFRDVGPTSHLRLRGTLLVSTCERPRKPTSKPIHGCRSCVRRKVMVASVPDISNPFRMGRCLI